MLLDQLVDQALMRTFPVIFEFLAKNIHVLVTNENEMIQAFLLNRWDDSLDLGNRIG